MGDYITLNILDVDYNINTEWSGITLSQANNLRDIIDKHIPENLKKKYELLHDCLIAEHADETLLNEHVQSIPHVDIAKNFPNFYGRVMSYLGNIPLDVMEKCNHKDREETYENHLEHFVFGLLFTPYTFSPTTRLTCTIDGQEYHTPESRWVLGREHPMGNATVVEYTEGAELETAFAESQGGSFKAIPTIVAILLRPKDEEYDEKVVMQRIKDGVYDVVDMELVYNVFFYLKKLLTTYQVYLALSSVREVKEQLKELEQQKKADYQSTTGT